MTRDEKNRRIAEALEPCPSEADDGGEYRNGVQFSRGQQWCRLNMIPGGGIPERLRFGGAE